MCFRMLKISAILSHFDIVEKTSDKNQKQKANFLQYFARKVIINDLKVGFLLK